MPEPIPLRIVLRGPNGEERERTFDGPVVRAGRAQDCDLVLDSGYISRVHARFDRSGSDWTVSDAGSRNGVYVNGTRVTGQERLFPGDVVRLGDFTLSLPRVPEAEDMPTMALPIALAESLSLPHTPAPPRQRVQIDLESGTVLIDGQPPHQPLTGRELRLLAALADAAPEAGETQALTDVGWGPAAGDEDMLIRLIHSVRLKLEADALRPEFVLDEPGIGYRLQPV